MSTRMARGMTMAAVIVVLLAFAWFSRRILLLSFSALLIALIFTSLTNFLRKAMPFGHKASYALVLLLLAILLTAVGLLLAPSMTSQFSELAEELPKRFSEFRLKVESSPIFKRISGFLPPPAELVPSGGASGVGKVFTSTFQMGSSFLFVSFTALFLAASPGFYRKMVVLLFPPKLRDKARDTLTRVICTLKYWLLGQFVAMTVVGLIIGISLSILGVPFAVPLGIIAGVAEFIPIVGPIISAVPALLLAMSQGGNQFLIVLGIFLGVQMLEGNLLMPLVQRKAIDLPPVITLVALLLLGESFGLLGLFVAAPLAAVVLVLLEDVYLKHYLQTEDKLLDSRDEREDG